MTTLFSSFDEIEDDDGILCVVCQSTDGDPSDPITFCDGYNLTVHNTYYGHPLTNGNFFKREIAHGEALWEDFSWVLGRRWDTTGRWGRSG
ncbi:hypothetical protein L1987_06184 [Smallanthus sonchifolius]|uniref:Uncharacterized protein n=1 Tax=Smallanthus sonchifolius TaxID=185202 RepID=A0ACB9JXE9_9ASTR|nr:hypothetical protein L1987_06184 [Smallanthus sonchifolius]